MRGADQALPINLAAEKTEAALAEIGGVHWRRSADTNRGSSAC